MIKKNQGICYRKGNARLAISAGVMLMMIALTAIVLSIDTVKVEIKLFAVICFWLYTVIFGLIEFKIRFAFLVFVLLIFLFLLSRPILALVYGVDGRSWSLETLNTVFKLIFISLAALVLACGYRSLVKGNMRIWSIQIRNEHSKVLVSYATFLLAVSGLALLYTRADMYFAYRNAEYVSLYLNHETRGIFLIRALSELFPLALALYLSLMPNKRNTVIALVLYVVTGVPVFLLGNRTSLVLPIVFASVYYVIRWVIEEGDTKWVKKRLLIAFCLFLFAAIPILGMMNYTREGKTISDKDQMPLVADFFYKQGTTFDTVCQGIEYKGRIEALPGEPVYSLSGITDTLKYGRVGRLIFGINAIPDGNSIDVVINKSSLAHRLSYVVMRNEYLAGHGRGSSYLIENYLDWGYIGVFVFSFVIGLLLVSVIPVFRKGNFVIRLLLLSCLMQIFIMPRAEATGFVTFLFAPYFWLLLFSCMVLLVITDANNDCITCKR